MKYIALALHSKPLTAITYSCSLAMLWRVTSLLVSAFGALSPSAVQCARNTMVGSGRGREKDRKRGERVGGICHLSELVRKTARSEMRGIYRKGVMTHKVKVFNNKERKIEFQP